MDNWLVSFPTTTEAITTAQRLTEALKRGGFPLTQWATANKEVRQSLPGQQANGTPVNMDLNSEPFERTLGLVWDLSCDVFILSTTVQSDSRTKRHLLKSIFNIFDPLGFLVPIVFQAKFFMQDIWRRK